MVITQTGKISGYARTTENARRGVSQHESSGAAAQRGIAYANR